MDRLIIQGIEQLHFLSSYYFRTMDELAKDLTNALDESSDRRNPDGKVRRTKSWKCRSHNKSKSGLILGSSVPKSSAKSEDSESSLETWIQHQMDFSNNGSFQHTDSDDRICKINHPDYHLTSWRHCSVNMAESDSVNENLYPSRETKRKRKFKRMTVDPPCETKHEFTALSNAAVFSQKNKRLRNIKSPKISKLSVKSSKVSKVKTMSQLSSKMENFCMDFGNVATSSGKRKRCSHERSIECNGCDCKGVISSKGNSEALGISSNPCHHLEYLTSKSHEIMSSGLSSSESECGILTNDESREADDEQSDFFQEAGPTCGIPNFSPWWEDDSLITDDKQFTDKKFQDILAESFRDMSENAKKMYAMQAEKYKCGRQIRSGRRRLKKEMASTVHGADEILPNLPLTNEYNCFYSSVDSTLSKTTLNEKKKRKGMPSSIPSVLGYGELSACIPDTNKGLQVLKNMGWKPGTGLGKAGEGITSPIKTSPCVGREGLGFVNKQDESAILSASVTNKNSSHSSPPPPHPQSPIIKMEKPV